MIDISDKITSLLISSSIPEIRLATSDGLIADLARQHVRSIDRVIEQAFEKHFGFPLSEVREKGSLEVVHYQDSPIEDYRYRGEVFLQFERSENIVVENDGSCAKVTMTSRYKEI